MDYAYKVADKVLLITPARFLFNAGATPKSWNQQMLLDKHFKVLHYEPNSNVYFSNTDIKGGVVISFHDSTHTFTPVELFTPFEELNSILQKVRFNNNFQSLSTFVIPRSAYRLSEKLHRENPDAVKRLSKGNEYAMSTNVFELLPNIFLDRKPIDGHEYIQMYGRESNQRVYKYVRRDYINDVINFEKFKVMIPSVNGSGAIGEVLSTPLIGPPLIGHTQSFISIGSFETLTEAKFAMQYIKSKFARVLLGVLKVTQHNPPEKWEYVPLQDFTENSDIDWTRSIPEIDQQLYKKYGLSQAEIYFIESKVREMN